MMNTEQLLDYLVREKIQLETSAEQGDLHDYIEDRYDDLIRLFGAAITVLSKEVKRNGQAA